MISNQLPVQRSTVLDSSLFYIRLGHKVCWVPQLYLVLLESLKEFYQVAPCQRSASAARSIVSCSRTPSSRCSFTIFVNHLGFFTLTPTHHYHPPLLSLPIGSMMHSHRSERQFEILHVRDRVFHAL
ncbi:MAG: hypothetical protein EZS28_039402 [Streblomastix strix]|uniref:Uncharacterized protein n=1 Tax=Streblomastix strix TaxID=222440 RepID=A0A5J4U4Z2_9EUKA|nr:MAG: hypothetical protein EZS28_039402 [Streblomastix strix]